MPLLLPNVLTKVLIVNNMLPKSVNAGDIWTLHRRAYKTQLI